MDKIIFRISELLKLKSIITIGILTVFIKMSLDGSISPENAFVVINSVILCYFTKDNKDSK